MAALAPSRRLCVRRAFLSLSPRRCLTTDAAGADSQQQGRGRHSLSASPLKELIRRGRPAIGALTDMHRDTTHVEMLGLLGYDYLWVDTEHSPGSPASCEALYLAAERRGLGPRLQPPNPPPHLRSPLHEAMFEPGH
jgi:hypothetical protein